jgi:hypothetical protein
MAGKSISHLSDVVTQATNTAGVETEILEIVPDDGTMLRFLNRVSTGAAEGIPVFADFRDSNGDPLPADTSVVITAQRPTDDKPVQVSMQEDNIAAWNQLTTAEQRNEENIDAVKIELKGEVINIRDKDRLFIEVESSAQIDWSNAELYFPREAVREVPYEG